MVCKASDLRNELAVGQPVCGSGPGWYRWWCDAEAAAKLLWQIGITLSDSHLLSKEIDGREYVAIYFGISKDLNARIKWHICQVHTPGSVRSGFLSTLRQSLSALLSIDMRKSQQEVNVFMDDNCWVEYDNVQTHEEAKNREKYELSQKDYFYPLNISGAKSTRKEIRNRLTSLRKMQSLHPGIE